MKKLIALLLTLVMVFSVCAVSTSSALAANTNEDRMLNLCITAALASTDRHTTVNIQDSMVLVQMNDGLVRFNDATGELEPRIAESWEVSEDGLTWTFYLREDAKFHNGDPVLASDVAFSIMRAKNSPICASKFSSVDDCVVVDDHTVQVNLVQPDGSWLIITNTMLAIYSEREVSELGDTFGSDIHTAGCGPYVMTRNDGLDTYWELSAFSDYYLGEPAIKKISYKPITDTAASVISLKSGELDYLQAPADSYESFAADDAFNTEVVPENHVTYLSINYTDPQLADKNLRQAIAYCIDKDTAILVSKNGLATLANFLYNPKTNTAAPEHETIYNYDIDKAKECLAKSSMPNGGKLNGKMLTIGGTYFEKVAVSIQQNLAEIGIDVEIETADLAAVGARLRSGDYFLGVFGGGANGDAAGLKEWYVSEAKGASTAPIWAGGEVDNAWVDDLMNRAGMLSDVAERKALYTEVDEYMMDLCIYVPMFRRANPYVWTKELNIPVNYAGFPMVREWSWVE